ncbi:MAG: efflux RND transporter periplasmic adaptor subunit [Acidobacteriota bacterium]
MRRNLLYLIIILVIITGTIKVYFQLSPSQGATVSVPVRAEAKPELTVAAAGLVEPVSEEIQLGAEIAGTLRSVTVEEGDVVKQGQVIAVIDNEDYLAQVAAAEARLYQKEVELTRLLNGARSEERREAEAAVQEAKTVLEQNLKEKVRRQKLHADGVISREEADRAEREYDVAIARLAAARERFNLIDTDAREEDRQRAEAEVKLQRAQLAEAKARLSKTVIRSPLSGTVLKKYIQSGELVAPGSVIVTVGDLSVLHVRADIDETDVNKVSIGQQAYAVADAYPNKKFPGQIVRLSHSLGKKHVKTERPGERLDTKVLEVLVKLDAGADLPVGLRVDVFIKAGKD